MRRLRTPTALSVLALAAMLTYGCADKTDYSDTNAPETRVSIGQANHPNYTLPTGARQFGLVEQRSKSMLGQANHGDVR